MPEIRVTPLSENITISSDELDTALSAPVKPGAVYGSISAQHCKDSYVVGTPYFKNLPFKREAPCIIPVNQVNLASKILKNTKSKQAMTDILKAEYQAIVDALLDSGIDFRILNLHNAEKEIQNRLKEKGCGELNFSAGQTNRWLMYPRDMFVYLKTINTLLVHSNLFKLDKDRSGDCNIIHTLWAEGGRVLFSGDRMLIGVHPGEGKRFRDSKVINLLRDRGMRIAAIPYALFYRLSCSNGKEYSLFYDSHIDRSASLIKGRDGGYHVLVDPGYRTGPLIHPLSVEKSIDRVRAACDTIQVQVHVPENSAVPYSTSVVQFNNGTVLATGGDRDVCAVLSDSAGSENIRTTGVPVAAYPVFASAGLHCLITENPSPLVD